MFASDKVSFAWLLHFLQKRWLLHWLFQLLFNTLFKLRSTFIFVLVSGVFHVEFVDLHVDVVGWSRALSSIVHSWGTAEHIISQSVRRILLRLFILFLFHFFDFSLDQDILSFDFVFFHVRFSILGRRLLQVNISNGLLTNLDFSFFDSIQVFFHKANVFDSCHPVRVELIHASRRHVRHAPELVSQSLGLIIANESLQLS